jgi:N-acetylneuraminic acid mutarotase
MKYVLLLSIVCLNNYFANAQSVAINNDGSVANINAILDIKSTTKGLLIPRMNKTEKLTISLPTEGLIIYQTAPDSLGMYVYNQGSWKWLNPNVTENWTKTGNDIYNKNTGNVGVGIANPSTKFQIMDSATSRTKMMIRSKNYLDTTTLIFKNRNNSEEGTDIILSSNQEFGLRFSSQSDLVSNNVANIFHLTPQGAVGINNGASLPQQTLDVSGAVKIGNSTNNVNGSIRYNAQGKLDLGNGTDWKNISLPSTALVVSETPNNAELLTNGYSYFGKINGTKDSTISIPPNSWHTISTSNLTAVNNPQSVWIGSQAFVFSGETFTIGYSYFANKSFLYNPVSDTWQETAPFPLTARYNVQIVWTGTEVIVWGGRDLTSNIFNDGAKYNPATNSWAIMTSANLPGKRFNAAAAWSGTEMLIWGGYNALAGTANLDSVFKYNPVTDAWIKIYAPTNRPGLATSGNTPLTHSVGGEMFVYTNLFPWHAKFNPVTNTWTNLQSSIGFAVNIRVPSVFTGTQLIYYGEAGFPATYYIGKYNVATNTWDANVNIPGAIGNLLEEGTTSWTGTEVIYIGGKYFNGTFDVYTTGVTKFNPTTNIFQTVFPQNGVITSKANHTAFYGSGIVSFWGGNTTESNSTNSGGRYFVNTVNAGITTEKPLFLFKKN